MLSRADKKALQAELDQAARAVDNGHYAWEKGAFGPANIAGVLNAQLTLASRLAEFEDRRDAGLCGHTLNAMRMYEQMATDLLDGIAALNCTDRREEKIQSPSGRWAISRQLLINDTIYEQVELCTNPAVGLLQLDRWEDELRASLHIRMAA